MPNVSQDPVAQLQRENHRLRREVERLSVFQQMAYRDSLTGLYNRRYFDERIDQELARSKRTGSPLALLMIDVDDLKAINDGYGHLVGDVVLRWTAKIIRKHCRSFDVPCRIGGDEFAMILLETGEGGACSFAARLRASARAEAAPPELAGERLRFSAGYTSTEGNVGSVQQLLAQADRSMYATKRPRRD